MDTRDEGFSVKPLADGSGVALVEYRERTKGTLDGQLDIPDWLNGNKVVRIGPRAFRNCLSLESIRLPSSVVSIGESAFAGVGILLKKKFMIF